MPNQLRCEACGIDFNTKEAMMEHGRRIHGMPSEHRQFKCQACGAEFESMGAMQEHGRKAHAM